MPIPAAECQAGECCLLCRSKLFSAMAEASAGNWQAEHRAQAEISQAEPTNPPRRDEPTPFLLSHGRAEQQSLRGRLQQESCWAQGSIRPKSAVSCCQLEWGQKQTGL